jgi:hypothetical protein
VLDIFTVLLAVVSLCALTGAISRMLFKQAKIWDEEDYFPEEIETNVNYDKLRKENPHIWIE